MEEYLKFIVQDIRGGVTIIFICSLLICIACLMDMWTGIDAARANKEKIRSKPLRKTGVKIVDYFRLIIIFVLIDILGLCFPWYNLSKAFLWSRTFAGNVVMLQKWPMWLPRL